MKTIQQPTIGRIVHVIHNNEPCEGHPAIVVKVHDDGSIDLCVFSMGGTDGLRARHASDSEGEDWAWTWPPRSS